MEKAEENGWVYTKDGSNARAECHGAEAGEQDREQIKNLFID